MREIASGKATSQEILKQNPSKLYLIDPWKSITDVPARWHAAPQDEMDAIYNGVASTLGSDDRVEIIRKLSDDAVSDIMTDPLIGFMLMVIILMSLLNLTLRIGGLN